MSIITTDNQNYINIANTIRAKGGYSSLYYPDEMALAILNLSTPNTSWENNYIERKFTSIISLPTSYMPSAMYAGYSFTEAFSTCSWLYPYAFAYCSSLSTASFPNCSNIFSYTFYGCVSLFSLYLMSTSVCTLSSSNAFLSTPIIVSSYYNNVYGSIFVPSSLVDTYKAATNWTKLSARFVGV